MHCSDREALWLANETLGAYLSIQLQDTFSKKRTLLLGVKEITLISRLGERQSAKCDSYSIVRYGGCMSHVVRQGALSIADYKMISPCAMCKVMGFVL